ncbi:Ankyrin repeats (3 copies) [Popillia japonica]|uniref:Ankyrin repeats (3 copies) n=1 Tax=Popillia japonica TaxID=7064 RepID=A0AAW1MJR3_POPJA
MFDYMYKPSTLYLCLLVQRTTWTQEMVYLIVSDLDYEGAKETLDKRFLHLECGILMDFKGYKANHPEFQCDDYLIEPIEVIKNLKCRRLIKTHLPWDLLPLEIRNGTKKPKIIHVFRNPKDVCVSYYYHSKLLRYNSSTLEEFCKLFLSGKTAFSPYWNNIYSYWNRRNLPNILFICYEAMKQDLASVIRKVTEFLEKKELNKNEMDCLVDHLSFSNMKKNPAVAKNELLASIYKCTEKKETNTTLQFIRVGKVSVYLVRTLYKVYPSPGSARSVWAEPQTFCSMVADTDHPATSVNEREGNVTVEADDNRDSLQKTIFDVVKTGEVSDIEELVEKTGSQILRARDEWGYTPAHWAALDGNVETMRYLVDKSAPIDLSCLGIQGPRPIHWACRKGHSAVVQVLLQAGVAVNAADFKGLTPLMTACMFGRTATAAFLLGMGALNNLVDINGDTALHWAAYKGHVDVMKLLMYSGADLQAPDYFGSTPLHLACISGSVTCVKLLCEKDLAFTYCWIPVHIVFWSFKCIYLFTVFNFVIGI